MFNHKKYKPFAFAPALERREWCQKTLTQAPLWASVDLRDGNQALITPMTLEQKMQFFELLVSLGFKHIEVGFPSASSVEFDFVQTLIHEQKIPDDVWIQVLVPARQELVRRTFQALEGVPRAIVHVYSTTSQVQRNKVYQKTQAQMMALAVTGAKLVQEYAKHYPDTEWIFQYSPESFSQTEPEFAVEVCQAVCDVWQPEQGQQVIINLPATVEASTPNVFADQVEYFCRHLPSRAHVTISLHTHNDRGCAVAAAELGLLAGADRIEGTLFGNGERTGNMDIVTMALNLYTQGVDPTLNLAKLASIAGLVTQCNQLPIHPRHPYVGELVFTAFSGSHQDAIKKSLDFDDKHKSEYWEVAYLPLDPKDVGRSYQDVVRINSQSGKGGAAYVLQRHYGFNLPRWLQIDFARLVQQSAEQSASELKNDELLALFEKQYLSDNTLGDYELKNHLGGVSFSGEVMLDGKRFTVSGVGNGALSAFIDGLSTLSGRHIYISNYAEHAIVLDDNHNKTDSQAVAYVELSVDGALLAGVATSSNTVDAMMKAALSAIALRDDGESLVL